MSDRAIALFVAILGSAVYLAVAFGAWADVGADRFGTYIYNYYFLALIEGRFDVPLRIVSLEGHYGADGRAYVYHGLAPLITRAIAWPFVDLKEVSLAPLTIALAAVGGTAVYHSVLLRIIEKFAAPNAALQRSAGVVLGIMIWFASPGLLLVANDSLFHEPTAMAYLFVACFLGLLAQVVFFRKEIASVLLPLAVFAGLCVYARPHLAVGLYAVVCLLALVLLWRKRWHGLRHALGAATILMAFGGVVLVFNELRFGNMLQMSSGGSTQHAIIFWGTESRESPRMMAFGHHGRFNVHRIVPNLMLYLFDLPGALGDGIERAYRALTSGLGYIRVETPRVGMVFLWLPWFVLALAGAIGRAAGLRHVWAPLLATGLGGLLMASYGTVTLRYRFDLWPFLIVLGMLGLPRLLLAAKAARSYFAIAAAGLCFTLVPSLFLMLLTAQVYGFKFVENRFFSRWSYETCAEMVTAKETLGADAVERLCGL